jgi:hypothetical protein
MFRSIRLLLAVGLVLVFAAPAGAATPVGKSQRHAILLVADLSQGTPLEKAFYNTVEFAAVAVGQTYLIPTYGQVKTITGGNAKLSVLRNALKTSAQKSYVKAIDLIFVSHGLTEAVLFSDGRRTMAEIRNDLVANLTAAQRAKLRMVFDTSCWSASHRSGWLGAGFKVASGSKQIYADSATSFPVFLTQWAVLGRSFYQAVGAANGADPAKLSDNAVRAFYKSKGLTSYANSVDSTRVILGNSSLTIGTMP